MADIMDRTINSILTAFIAVILLASAFIPVAINQINAIPDLVSVGNEGDLINSLTPYTTLLSVVIIVTIVGIVIGVIKQYTDEER